MNKQIFTKKIFTIGLFFNDLAFLIINFPKIIAALKNKKISKIFFEKVMTVTSAVNGCVYCQWYHAKKAVSSGMTKNEIKNLLNLQFQTDASDIELTALMYAQHYAETNRKPDTKMTENLFSFYDKKTASHILIIIRMIFFGNLYGNTFDSFLSRFKGNRAKISNIFFEFLFFLINIPFMLPIMPFVKKYRSNN